MATSNANQDDGIDQANGDTFIPASQRPDGTWRKARRVKGGYVPQEEVPLYESKGKKIMNKQPEPAQPAKVEGYICHKTIPGLFIEEKTAKQKKKANKESQKTNVDQATKNISKLTMGSETAKKQPGTPTEDPIKKLKNLRKRLREVEALELKIKNREILNPEPEQLTKVGRKNELILQIYELEKAK